MEAPDESDGTTQDLRPNPKASNRGHPREEKWTVTCAVLIRVGITGDSGK